MDIPTAIRQSFNRYAYLRNDPVNFVDPSGLDTTFYWRPPPPWWPPPPDQNSSPSGGGGGGGLHPPLQDVDDADHRGGPATPQEPAKPSHDKQTPKNCYDFANIVGELAKQYGDDPDKFAQALWDRFANRSDEFSSEGFKTEFQDHGDSPNQARHYVGGFYAAYQWGGLGAWVADLRESPHPDFSDNPPWRKNPTPKPGKKSQSQIADTALNGVSTRHGIAMLMKQIKPGDLKQKILDEVCEKKK